MFYLKYVENKSEYFHKKFLQKKSDFFRKFHVFKVIFAPEIKKRIKKKKSRLTDPTWEVRPPVKQGIFFVALLELFFFEQLAT